MPLAPETLELRLKELEERVGVWASLERLAKKKRRGDGQEQGEGEGEGEEGEDLPLHLIFAAVYSAFSTADFYKERLVGEVLPAVLGSSAGWLQMTSEGENLAWVQEGLARDPENLRKLTIKSLVAAVDPSANDALQRRCRSEWLIFGGVCPSLAKCAAGKSVAVAEGACNAIVDILKSYAMHEGAALSSDEDGLTSAFTTVLGALMAGEGDGDVSIVSVRKADTVARCAGISNEAFLTVKRQGYLKSVMDIVSNGADPLLRLNGMEMLQHIASVPTGCRDLFENGVVESMLDLATGTCEGLAPDPLLGGQALTTLSDIFVRASAMDAEVWAILSPTLSKRFLRICMSHVGSHNDSSQLAGMWSVCNFARSSPAALEAILRDPELLKCWLLLDGKKVAVKGAALHSIAKVFGLPPSQTAGEASASSDARFTAVNAAEEHSELCRQLWDELGNVNNKRSTMDLLMGLLGPPVPEIRHGVYDVLRCTAHQKSGWGLRRMLVNSKLVDYLEDTGTETSKEGMELKFCVVQALMDCDQRAVMGQETLARLEDMLKKGPFPPKAAAREVRTAA